MIKEQFAEAYKWIVNQGVDEAGLDRRLNYLYQTCADIFDLHFEVENMRLPDARKFDNVPVNAMMKVVVMDVLTHMLEFDIERKEKLLRATAVPNIVLHVTKRPQDFPDNTGKIVREKLGSLEYDRDLVFAAGPWFFDSNIVDIATDDELLMLLASDLVDETEIGKPTIMDVDTHINGLKRKERDDLKDPYWDRELNKDHEVMEMFFPGKDYSQFPNMILNHLQAMVV